MRRLQNAKCMTDTDGAYDSGDDLSRATQTSNETIVLRNISEVDFRF
jgi:biotin operon repressor